MIDSEIQNDAQSEAKLPQLGKLSHDLSTKTQQSRLAAKQRFTRTITLVLN